MQGRGGGPFDCDYFRGIHKEYTNRRFDVLVLSMTDIGLNSGSMWFSIKTKRSLAKNTFGTEKAKDHYIYEECFGANTADPQGRSPM